MYQGGYLTGRIHKLTGRKINELLKKNGVKEMNGAQGTILFALWTNESLTIKEITKMTGLAKTSLTSMLERMRQADLIGITDNPEDGRSKLITLTDKSRKLRSVYEKISADMTDCWYRGFSEEEILRFEEMLEKVLHNIESFEVGK